MLENFWSIDSLNPAAFAIPAFFIFTGLEYVAARRQNKKHIFKFDSCISNMSIGVAERLLNLSLTATFYSLFQFVYQNFALWSIPNTPVVWILLILATDLVWYWYHRLGHEINLFWAAHIVHHQSEEFNYTVSARITTLQAIIRNLFWCLLPLAGFHPAMVITTLIIHGTYSFFTHTQIIHKLGWLEHILITPSHHRVHHAANEKYLNKNYGDLFVFWDKLFGTFQREDEKPVFGLTHPLKSHSFIWQHIHYFLEIIEAAKQKHGLKNKLRIVFGRPEDLDQAIRPALEKKYLSRSKFINASIRHKNYVQIQFVAVVILLFITSLCYSFFDLPDLLFLVSLIFVTLINCGALIEQRTWICYLEQIRIIILIVYVGYIFDEPFNSLVAVILTLIAGSGLTFRQWFLKFVYG